MIDHSMKMLFDEHTNIVNAIDAVHHAKRWLGTNDAKYSETVKQLLHFFRNYADKYHHYKEEEILFPEMSKKNELLADGVINEMLDNHEDFREMLGSVEEDINLNNFQAAHQTLEKYAELLLEHIAVENDELFQMAYSLFSDDELERIKYRFEDCDRELGQKNKEELVHAADELRKGFLMDDDI